MTTISVKLIRDILPIIIVEADEDLKVGSTISVKEGCLSFINTLHSLEYGHEVKNGDEDYEIVSVVWTHGKPSIDVNNFVLIRV